MADADRFASLRSLEAHLQACILGQERVVARVASALIRAELDLTPRNRPRSSFLLVGPTGTGKTELSLCFTRYLLGPDRLHRFDLSEYQNQTSVEKLLGSDRSDPGLLGRCLAAQSRGTLLFDELEKAHPLVLDLFLQMLDAARITVATGTTYDLSDWYLVFTSNIGSAEAMRMERSGPASVEAAVLRRVSQVLRPELVGRIDEKLVFSRLSSSVQGEICALLARRETARLHELGHEISLSREALEFLVREGYDPHFGARPMRAAVERHLQEAVVRELLRAGVVAGAVTPDHMKRRLVLRPKIEETA